MVGLLHSGPAGLLWGFSKLFREAERSCDSVPHFCLPPRWMYHLLRSAILVCESGLGTMGSTRTWIHPQNVSAPTWLATNNPDAVHSPRYSTKILVFPKLLGPPPTYAKKNFRHLSSRRRAREYRAKTPTSWRRGSTLPIGGRLTEKRSSSG